MSYHLPSYLPAMRDTHLRTLGTGHGRHQKKLYKQRECPHPCRAQNFPEHDVIKHLTSLGGCYCLKVADCFLSEAWTLGNVVRYWEGRRGTASKRFCVWPRIAILSHNGTHICSPAKFQVVSPHRKSSFSFWHIRFCHVAQSCFQRLDWAGLRQEKLEKEWDRSTGDKRLAVTQGKKTKVFSASARVSCNSCCTKLNRERAFTAFPQKSPLMTLLSTAPLLIQDRGSQ